MNETKTLAVRGAFLPCSDSDGTGKPALLLHGAVTGQRMWDCLPQERRLSCRAPATCGRRRIPPSFVRAVRGFIASLS